MRVEARPKVGPVEKRATILLFWFYGRVNGNICSWALYRKLRTAEILGEVQLTGKSQELPRKAASTKSHPNDVGFNFMSYKDLSLAPFLIREIDGS